MYCLTGFSHWFLALQSLILSKYEDLRANNISTSYLERQTEGENFCCRFA